MPAGEEPESLRRHADTAESSHPSFLFQPSAGGFTTRSETTLAPVTVTSEGVSIRPPYGVLDALMVQAKLAKQSCDHVRRRQAVDHCLISEVVGLAVDQAFFEASAGNQMVNAFRL